MISNRLSNLSCSKEVFLSEVPVYQDAQLTQSRLGTTPFQEPHQKEIDNEKLFGLTLLFAKQ
jgi:hypothetical protein